MAMAPLCIAGLQLVIPILLLLLEAQDGDVLQGVHSGGVFLQRDSKDDGGEKQSYWVRMMQQEDKDLRHKTLGKKRSSMKRQKAWTPDSLRAVGTQYRKGVEGSPQIEARR